MERRKKNKEPGYNVLPLISTATTFDDFMGKQSAANPLPGNDFIMRWGGQQRNGGGDTQPHNPTVQVCYEYKPTRDATGRARFTPTTGVQQGCLPVLYSVHRPAWTPIGTELVTGNGWVSGLDFWKTQVCPLVVLYEANRFCARNHVNLASITPEQLYVLAMNGDWQIPVTLLWGGTLRQPTNGQEQQSISAAALANAQRYQFLATAMQMGISRNTKTPAEADMLRHTLALYHDKEDKARLLIANSTRA